tara:strand:- start:405 stop:662 length:258 start_codon:yes stop_codon:yes gene_type:complete
MIKELRNLFYILVIFIFIYFIGKYYFSDDYKKKTYRSLKLITKNVNKNNINLITLKSDTENITESINNISKKKKKYKFWKLLENK